jgi:hypothetical protein
VWATVKELQLATLNIFCWCAFSWSICDKSRHIIGESRATVSKVMSAYTNHGKATSGERKCGRKSTFTERDRHI